MNPWASFWWWVVTIALTAYFGLGVVIAIGGFFDVKRMFRRLKEAHEEVSRRGGGIVEAIQKVQEESEK